MSNPKNGAPKRKVTRQDQHVQKESKRRKNLAIQIFYGDRPIVLIGKSIYSVPSGTSGDIAYIVNLKRNICECKFWRKTHETCKHIYAARMYREQIEGRPVPAPETGLEPVVYKHPPYYEKLRRVRRPCMRELLRCIGKQVDLGF
jgi:hypothetical protein